MARSNSKSHLSISLIIGSLLLFLFTAMPAAAANRVHIDIAKSGNVLTPYDTLFVGGEYQLRFWLENDFVLGA